jgi:3-oxoacyl-[acyl-carrier-protein] synthase II
MKRRVVITGMGLVTPLGHQLQEVWNGLCQGQSGIRAVTNEKHKIFRSQISGECRDFTPQEYIPHRETKRIERFAQFALCAAIDAVKHSGLDFEKENPERCAAVIGSGCGGLGEIEAQYDRLMEKGPAKVSAFTIPKMMLNAASGHVSIHFGIFGPAYGVATACASSSNAMADALKMIRQNESDIVITGGTEAAVTKLGLAGFCAMRALSERNDEPQRASRPFDQDRDGFVLGEGCGILVFEELQHAKQRGAEILAEVVGIGVTADATHITQPDADGVGASKAMQYALEDAEITPDQLGYINAHGTSTTLGDVAETVAIKKVYQNTPESIPPISSTKSHIGHLLGGSGGVELIFSVEAMRHGIIPPTINLENPDPQCDLDYTPLHAREAKVDYALSNSFGFGGHNACMIVKRFNGP